MFAKLFRILFHAHDWQVVSAAPVLVENVRVGDRFILRCSKCGELKRCIIR